VCEGLDVHSDSQASLHLGPSRAQDMRDCHDDDGDDDNDDEKMRSTSIYQNALS